MIVFKTLYIYECNLYYTFVNVYMLCRGCNFWQILLKFGIRIPFCKSLDKCFSQNNPIIREFTPVWGSGRCFPRQPSFESPKGVLLKKTPLYLLQYDTTHFYFTLILWFSFSFGSIFVKIIFSASYSQLGSCHNGCMRKYFQVVFDLGWFGSAYLLNMGNTWKIHEKRVGKGLGRAAAGNREDKKEDNKKSYKT